jgi:6-pyruvoyltetrahydropterin/6-carboxytetrahydropterin synthase
MSVCTRILEFDAAHRITRHGSKCRHLHGHRYKAEITCRGSLNDLGMVIDFGEIKQTVGAWIDEHWDHGAILNEADEVYAKAVEAQGHRLYLLPCEPTAEHMARELLAIAGQLIGSAHLEVLKVRLWETPNCYADAESHPASPIGRSVGPSCV